MEATIVGLWNALGAVHVLWYVSLGIILYVLHDKGYLRYPGTAKAQAAREASLARQKADREDEAKPLRERLKAKAAERYDTLCETYDSDDAYKFLLNQIRAELSEADPVE